MANNKVVFKYGNRADYDSIAIKNPETLYFLLDTGEIYRGDVNLARGKHYEVIKEPTDTLDAAFEKALNGKPAIQDDICIVKELIQDDKYSYTAYVYNNGSWNAMDGNYNAENVYFDENLTFTKEVGYLTLENGKATLASAGKNMKQVFEMLFSKEEDPDVTQPSVTWGTVTGMGAKEAGTKVSPSYSASLNTGSYEYGPSPTGVAAASYSVSLTDGTTATETLTTASGTFSEITVTGNMKLSLKATITHSAGLNPYTNLNNVNEELAISAGSKTATYGTNLTGYRKIFHGALSTENALDSAAIRGLNKSAQNGAMTITWKAADYDAPLRYIVAIPSDTKKITSAILTSSWNTPITDLYVKQTATIAVEGANGYTAIPYDIYIYRPDTGVGSDEVHSITIG